MSLPKIDAEIDAALESTIKNQDKLPPYRNLKAWSPCGAWSAIVQIINGVAVMQVDQHNDPEARCYGWHDVPDDWCFKIICSAPYSAFKCRVRLGKKWYDCRIFARTELAARRASSDLGFSKITFDRKHRQRV